MAAVFSWLHDRFSLRAHNFNDKVLLCLCSPLLALSKDFHNNSNFMGCFLTCIVVVISSEVQARLGRHLYVMLLGIQSHQDSLY
jgi:hypothetical protein